MQEFIRLWAVLTTEQKAAMIEYLKALRSDTIF